MTDQISSKLFSYDKKQQVFTAEISEVPGVLGLQREHAGGYYGSGFSKGFEMVSNATGRAVEFMLFNITRDREGDIQFWTFIPTPESVKKHPDIKFATVRVYND